MTMEIHSSITGVSPETPSFEERSALKKRAVQSIGPKSIADIEIKGTPTPDWVSPLINRSIDVVLYGSAFSALGASMVFMPYLIPISLILFSLACGRNILKMDIGQFRQRVQNQLAKPTGEELKRFFESKPIAQEMMQQFQHHPTLKKPLKKMQEIAEKGDSCSVEDIRRFHKAYNAIARSETFKQAKPEDPLVFFMEELAYALYENVDLMPIYREVGRVINAPIFEEFEKTEQHPDRPFQKLAFVMGRAMRNPGIPILGRDTLAQTLLWTFIFPEKAIESIKGHTQKEHYTEIDKTNMIGKGWVYNYGEDNNIQSLIGPGTLDPIAQMHFRAKHRKGEPVLHMNLQHSSIKGEAERIDGLKELGNSSEYIDIISYPMDGPNWRIPEERLDFKTAKEFYQNCEPDPNFLTSPNQHIDQVQREIITNHSGAILDRFIPENPHWKTMDKQRQGKMMQLFAGGLLFMGANQQLSQKDGKNKTQKSPCKQQIDRGATMATYGKILDTIAKGEEFSDDLLDELDGFLITRAYHTEGRGPLTDRTNPLGDFIQFISSFDSKQREELQGQLNAFLAEYAS